MLHKNKTSEMLHKHKTINKNKKSEMLHKHKTIQGSRVRPIWSHVRPNFSRVRLKKTLVALVRPAIRKKKSPRLKVSAVRQQTR